jgi:hypothetical protein
VLIKQYSRYFPVKQDNQNLLIKPENIHPENIQQVVEKQNDVNAKIIKNIDLEEKSIPINLMQIKSDTSPNIIYDVNLNTKKCSCLYHTHTGSYCEHIKMAEKIVEKSKPIPTLPESSVSKTKIIAPVTEHKENVVKHDDEIGVSNFLTEIINQQLKTHFGKNTLIKVKSFTDSSVSYDVNLHNKTCTCPNYVHKKAFCKHLKFAKDNIKVFSDDIAIFH